MFFFVVLLFLLVEDVFLFVVLLCGIGLFAWTRSEPISQHQTNSIENIIVEETKLAKVIDGRKSQVISHLAYTVSYNDNWKLPNWVAYELTKQETMGEVARCNGFSPDPKVGLSILQ